MKKVLVYCHGYNSSATTDKVQRLKDEGYEVHAWNININPDISIPELTEKVDDLLMDHMHQDIQLIFVGTSLGGWYANVLGDVFDTPAVCVNPASSPRNQLLKVGASEEVANLYDDAIFGENHYVVVAEDDDVIPVNEEVFHNAAKFILSETGGHRFNGKEFQIVLDLIKEL